MRRFGVLLVAACIMLPCAAQTLREALHQAGIPSALFGGTDLDESINAISATRTPFTYLVYMRVGNRDLLTGFPQIVRYDARSGEVIRRELQAGEADECCGSPLEIVFTQDYLVISFHTNPSADTELVVDGQMRLTEILYGFDFHEIAPDQVVFIEDMIHFAPQHPERLRFVNLRTGRTQELYPPRGDALRADFAHANQDHMPPQADCRQANDPCAPDLFDETIQFLSSNKNGGFEIRVDREASHPQVPARRTENHLTASAIYKFRRTGEGWFYCERPLPADSSAARAILPENAEACTPNLPVIADSSGEISPFPAIVRKLK